MAVKWLLTSVCALVHHQSRSVSKTFPTLITLVWFLSRVSAHMTNNIRPSRETFITQPTTMRNARDSRVQWEDSAAAAAATTMSADVSDVPPPHRKNPNADIDSL